MLADSPRNFERSSHIRSVEETDFPPEGWVSRPPYSITNKGLAIAVPQQMTTLRPLNRGRMMADKVVAIMQLHCESILYKKPYSPNKWIYIVLIQETENEWVRIGLPYHIASFESECGGDTRPSMRTIRIQTRLTSWSHQVFDPLGFYELESEFLFQGNEITPNEELSERMRQNAARAKPLTCL